MKRIPTRALISGVLAVAVLVIAAASSLAGDAPRSRAESRNDGGFSVPGSSGSGLSGSTDPGGSGGSGGSTGSGAIGMCVAPTGPTGPETPVCKDVIVDPDPGYDVPEPDPQVVEPTPGMAGVRARPYDTATIADDDVTVTIDFVSGVEPCYVLDRVDVAYGPDAVTITLFEGHDPDQPDAVCIEIGVFKRVVISLDEPLDGRTLVDGVAA